MKKNAFLSFFLVAGILLALFFVNGFAPFGAESLAGNDARVQYIDFFLYFKDVLAGQNSIRYTFSKLLGGTAIALYSYYLASPLTLLVVFFPKTEILSFIDLLILLKASLAAAAFSVFLSVRFPDSGKTSDKRFFSIFLSAGYGLSQYVLAQCSNIMWLDGVILLPLVLLGVYEVVKGKALWRLAVPVALSVLFNWYTAGMNCLFAAVWFVLEYALLATEPDSNIKQIGFFRAMGRWIAGMLLGLLCSAFLFVPTVYAMTGNQKGDLNFWLFLFAKIRCPLYVPIESTIYGVRSTDTSLSLFCGVLPLLGMTSLFLKKERPIRKLIFALFLLFLALMFCWFPLYSLFNLLELPTSYYCRFSYLQVFGLLFVASWSFLASDETRPAKYWLSAVIYAAVLLLVYLYAPYEEFFPVWLTALALLLVSFFLDLYLKLREGLQKKIFPSLLALLLIADLGFNTYLQLSYTGRYANAGAETPVYITGQQKLINSLREYDPGTYRITQTRNRWTDEGRWTANYDEPFAYNYWSVSEYSSTVSAAQLCFLEQAGYQTEADVISVVNTSVLGTDSLLGVRYILTDVPVNGTVKVTEIPGFDGKEVYLNPYALPMAFRFNPGSTAAALNPPGTDNPFEYQNRLYSELLDEEVELYTPLEYTSAASVDPVTEEPVRTYQLHLPEGNFAVYGSIPWETSQGMPSLNLNSRDRSVYASWLSPSVFYVPVNSGDREAAVVLSGRVSFDEGVEQFYALDLDLLEQVTETLKSSPVLDSAIQNGSITAQTEAASGDYLFLSVPRDRGWKIRLNGEPVEPEFFADLFYTIPLAEGENVLTMQYRIPFLTEGILLSVLGLSLLLASALSSRKRRS